MAEGTIKKLTDRGFGFIRTESGQEIFFHAQNVEGVEFDDLHEGQAVAYDEGRGDKGPRAENVTPV
jgi:CspA family cold shock protein